MKRTVFIGSVISSKVALETIISCGVSIDLVCSLDSEVSQNVSDYYPIHEIAASHGIPYLTFKKVNEIAVLDRISQIKPDLIFVVGLSQIIPENLLNLPKMYCIGFHPTPLPQLRGRAAIPWQILLGIQQSMITLFKLDAGMDSGDIFIRYPYQISEDDYAADVYEKICIALRNAITDNIHKIYNGSAIFLPQNEEDATYLLARRPEDGVIFWNHSAVQISRLVRASSKPYPGAFTYYNLKKVTIWRARAENNNKYIGLPGQIAWINSQSEIGVITETGILVIEELESSQVKFSIGKKFKNIIG